MKMWSLKKPSPKSLDDSICRGHKRYKIYIVCHGYRKQRNPYAEDTKGDKIYIVCHGYRKQRNHGSPLIKITDLFLFLYFGKG